MDEEPECMQQIKRTAIPRLAAVLFVCGCGRRVMVTTCELEYARVGGEEYARARMAAAHEAPGAPENPGNPQNPAR